MDIQNIDFHQLRKNLKKQVTSGKTTIKVAILADSASQLVRQAITGYGIGLDIQYDILEADYNQIDRQIFDETSELYQFAPEFVLILRSTEKLLKEFYKQEPGRKRQFAEQQGEYTESLYEAILKKLPAKVITGNFIEINDNVFGNYANKVSSSFLYQIRMLNCRLMEMAQRHKNFFICDIAALVTPKGYNTSFDPKMYATADMVFSLDFLPTLAKNIHDIISSTKGGFKKCLILDLDNTTWGGIIGDDGLEGIQIGDLGLGKIYTGIQLWAKELVRRGIILAVCSKNSEEIAKAPFLDHPEMELRLEDVAIFVANWENKVDNIRHIQEVLNIGFDSMVFLDDNPFERDMVRQAIPGISVPSLPEDPAEYLLYLREQNLFETASYTEEDAERTRQYQEEAKRTVFQKSFSNEREFLESLKMTSEVRSFNNFTIPRIAQLSQRSNQFNLRTVRYTEKEACELATDPLSTTLSFTLKDVYGDYGLIAFVVMRLTSPEELFIENWAMSCRVLKRGMEQFTLQCLKEVALEKGCKRIIGEYLPTPKNGLVKDHYQKLGFTRTSEHVWALDLQEGNGFSGVYIERV